jgi:hypothetical protein
MKVIRNRVFEKRYEHNRQVIEGYELEGCTFDGWAGIRPDWDNPDPQLRATIRNVTLRNTKAYGFQLSGAIIEDVVVETTKGGKSPFFLRGNVYRHVTLKGRIAWTSIRGQVNPPLEMPEEERQRIIVEWDKANAEYYKTVDWALDITQADYGSLDIDGVPTRLVRRNPQNTGVVTRKRALEGKWRKVVWSNGVFHFVISDLLRDGYEDALLIACPRSKNYKDQLEDLQTLRDMGVAE